MRINFNHVVIILPTLVVSAGRNGGTFKYENDF
jgi:hypothetical protein